MKKLQLFHQNHGLSPLQKSQFSLLFKSMFILSRKVCLLYKRSKIVLHYFFSQSMTWEYRGLQGVTGGYKGLQGVTRGYKGLQGVTEGDKGWHGVSKDYTNFFLTRTFRDTFSWSILHKNQSWRNLKFLTKTMEKFSFCVVHKHFFL